MMRYAPTPIPVFIVYVRAAAVATGITYYEDVYKLD